MHALGRPLVWLGLLLAVGVVHAQQTADAGAVEERASGGALRQRGWAVNPSIALDLTHTDNVRLQANGESDFITRVSPGIRIQGQSARAKANIDFKLQQISYAQSEGRDRLQRQLNGTGTIELVEDWLFLDMSGRIARQAISAFAAPASGSDSINGNMIETTTYEVSPYIKGRLGSAAKYQLRFGNTQVSASAGPMRDTTIQSIQADLSGTTSFSRLDWGVSSTAQQSSYAGGAKNETDALRGTLTYMVDPQLRFTVIGGEETNDYINFQKQTSSITGWGFNWAPTARTQLAWTQEKRYFGNGHRLNFSHRTPFTAWRLSDTRDVVVRPPQSMSFSMGTYYELLDQQLQSSIPDDNERARYIEALLQSLQIPPDAQVLGGFMSSRASLNRTQEASFTMTGVRNTVTFSVQRQDRTAVGSGLGIVPDDFSNFGSTIEQKGLNLNWAYKLTPTATFTLMANTSRTTGSGGAAQVTDRDMLTLMMSKKIGARTSASLGVRKTTVSGFVDYVENAILGSLVMIF